MRVRELFWHVGELETRAGHWHWRRRPIALPKCAVHLVPVLRLDPTMREPFRAEALEELLALLKTEIATQHWNELQIDCDTPDRLLDSYAAALGQIHRLVPRLSVTALAGWSRDQSWPALQQAVAEIFPMFYDLKPDPNGQPLPLLSQSETDAQLHEWSACRIPWRAGLPNFARLTVYDQAGKSRGHIRDWQPNDLSFNRALADGETTGSGTVLLRPKEAINLNGTPIAAGETLAARWPDRAVLAHAIRQSETAKARGIVYFRLPDGSAGGGWSLAQLQQLDTADSPALVLRRADDGTLCLTNDSGVDLPPRLAGEGELDRGYALEIESASPIWREAMAGDFWRVAGHANPETKPAAVPIPLATRLTFWFSELHAGAQLKTGLIQTAPGASAAPIRYRVLHLAADESWRELK